MFDFLDGPVREAITALYETVGYLGVALWVALETVVIPIPSELILPFAGFLAGSGGANAPIEPLTGAPWSLPLLAVSATSGSLLGGLVSYAIGARLGRPALVSLCVRLGLDPGSLARVETWFARHGSAAALFGRCVPVLRSLVGYAAGLGRMPLGRYLLYTALGSLPFNLALLGAGALLGANWEGTIAPFLKGVERGVLALLFVFACLSLVRWWRRR